LKFNVVKLVEELRNQRGGMVQQPEQLKFCYETILESCAALGFDLEDNEKRHKQQKKQRQMELLHSAPVNLGLHDKQQSTHIQSDDSNQDLLSEDSSTDLHSIKHSKRQTSATDIAALQHHNLSSTLSPLPEDFENLVSRNKEERIQHNKNEDEEQQEEDEEENEEENKERKRSNKKQNTFEVEMEEKISEESIPETKTKHKKEKSSSHQRITSDESELTNQIPKRYQRNKRNTFQTIMNKNKRKKQRQLI